MIEALSQREARHLKNFRIALERVVGKIPDPVAHLVTNNNELTWMWIEGEFRFVYGAPLSIEHFSDGKWLRFPNRCSNGIHVYPYPLIMPEDVAMALCWFKDYEHSNWWRRRKLRRLGILPDTDERGKP